MARLLLLIVLCFIASIAYADLSVIQKVSSYTADTSKIESDLNIINALGDKENKEFIQSYKNLQEKKMESEILTLDHNQKVIYSNYIFTIIIFISVHIALFIGLYISAKEIKLSEKIKKNTKENELSLSISSIALKTSLNGIILFVVTIALYFLFIKYVYPITIIDSTQVQSDYNNKETINSGDPASK